MKKEPGRKKLEVGVTSGPDAVKMRLRGANQAREKRATAAHVQVSAAQTSCKGAGHAFETPVGRSDPMMVEKPRLSRVSTAVFTQISLSFRLLFVERAQDTARSASNSCQSHRIAATFEPRVSRSGRSMGPRPEACVAAKGCFFLN